MDNEDQNPGFEPLDEAAAARQRTDVTGMAIVSSRLGMRYKPGGHRLEADEKTVNQLQALGQIAATMREAAAVLGVPLNTFAEFLKREAIADEAYHIGLEQSKASLRRAQFKTALAGNPSLLIWLGKQFLGQKDNMELSGAVDHVHSVSDPHEAFETAILRVRERRGNRGSAGSGPVDEPGRPRNPPAKLAILGKG